MWSVVMGWLKQYFDSQSAGLRMMIEERNLQLDACHAEIFKLRKQLPSIPVEAIPDDSVSVMSMQAMYALVAENKLRFTYGGPLDEDYYYPTYEWWLKILKDIIPKVPPWVKDRKDCDGFGVMMKGIIEWHYGFNACGITDGEQWVDWVPEWTPGFKPHDWFGFVSEKGLRNVDRGGNIWQCGTTQNYQENRIYI